MQTAATACAETLATARASACVREREEEEGGRERERAGDRSGRGRVSTRKNRVPRVTGAHARAEGRAAFADESVKSRC
eukprot:2461296-Pleurochrysis_carterae.AAC.2